MNADKTPASADASAAVRIARSGRVVALAGVIAPLLLIGSLKFTTVEIEALKPLIGGTPWLAWMHSAFGFAGASYVLGVVELITAALLLASPWSRWAGAVGGAAAAFTFIVTSSLLLALPVWEQSLGGFPALNMGGQFLIKDIALCGIALVVLGESLGRVPGHLHRGAIES